MSKQCFTFENEGHCGYDGNCRFEHGDRSLSLDGMDTKLTIKNGNPTPTALPIVKPVKAPAIRSVSPTSLLQIKDQFPPTTCRPPMQAKRKDYEDPDDDPPPKGAGSQATDVQPLIATKKKRSGFSIIDVTGTDTEAVDTVKADRPGLWRHQSANSFELLKDLADKATDRKDLKSRCDVTYSEVKIMETGETSRPGLLRHQSPNSFGLLNDLELEKPDQENLKSRYDMDLCDLRKEALEICAKADKASKVSKTDDRAAAVKRSRRTERRHARKTKRKTDGDNSLPPKVDALADELKSLNLVPGDTPEMTENETSDDDGAPMGDPSDVKDVQAEAAKLARCTEPQDTPIAWDFPE